jgi:hypothetical protein
MARNSKPVRLGQAARKSGQCAEVGPRGGRQGNEVTMPKGHKMPPTSKPGHGYQLVDPSKNKSGE